MKTIKSLILKIASFFVSDKAEAVLKQAAALVPTALPIVKEIAALTPTRSDDELVAAFEKYAVPGVAQYLATPREKRGYVLFQLASEALSIRVPGTATRILNTAVQLAVAGSQA